MEIYQRRGPSVLRSREESAKNFKEAFLVINRKNVKAEHSLMWVFGFYFCPFSVYNICIFMNTTRVRDKNHASRTLILMRESVGVVFL